APRAQRRESRAAPLILESDAALQGLLVAAPGLFSLLERGLLVVDQPGERLPYERGVSKIAARDQLAIRMAAAPALAVAEQLLDLAVTDPVVLVRVQDRYQDVEVREQVAQPTGPRQGHREVRARPERIQDGIERVLLGGHLVAGGLEQPSQQALATPARHDRERRRQGQGASVSSGRSVLRPAIAEPN